ncbi:hypothetical protein [Bacteroides neonati]|uniref:hypothetical protein n=1 Tax=Bacteroides neonati TaxID=1347393 RepID=UPI0004B3F5AB|nr:hypothetical protein [Bacteroides neonati]
MSDVIIYEGAAIPFSFSRQNGQPLDVTSVMRTLADITTYAANAEKKYVPYEGQTIACLEDKMLYILELKNGVLVPKLSGGVKLIKRDDNVELTDDAALSALRSVKEIEERAISRTKRDTAAEVIEFVKGLTAAGGKTTVSGDGKITTLNLLVQALAEVYDLNVSHVATMMRTIIKDYVSSEAFTPGLLGEGFKISKAINGDWNLEIDNVVVRKVMTIFEMIISKVRSVNGGLVISPANGRIKSVAETTGSPAYYVIGIEGDMQFVVDDYVRCQVFSNGHAKYYWVRVSSISNNSILVLKSEFTNRAVPAIGDDLVQMGNATNKARQGLIYLTASEDGKPRISVMDGVNSTSLVGKNKVILGSLDGITDTDFPADFQPSGYGLYAMNVFLKGIFVLRNGKSVEGEIEAAQNAASVAQAKADTVTRLFQEFTVAGGVFESKITEVKEYADDKVSAIQVGGRNLALNSGVAVSNASYKIHAYRLSENLVSGNTYILTIWGILGAGRECFSIWIGGGYTSLGRPAVVTDERYQLIFVCPDSISGDGSRDVVHVYHETAGLSSVSTINLIKLERGNKPTDWTPAPEDVTADAQTKANAAQAAAEAVAIAKATLAKTEANAYADGIVTEEEKRAIADAQAKLAEAKLDAQAKANDAKQAAIADAANKYPTKSEVSTSIKQLSDSISLKAEKTEVTGLGNRVSAAEATLTVQANQIASKVSQSDFNTLGQRVGSAESAITQQATQITAQVTAVNDLTGRVASAELALNPDNIWLGLTAKVDGAIESKVKTGISIAGNEVSIFGTTILNGNLIAGIISATNITTGKLTVTDNAKIGEFLVQNNSLVNNDFRASLQIGDSDSLRYVKIGGDSLNLAKIQVAGENTVGLNITTYKPTVGRYPHTNYAIKSVGSHVFKQRGAVDQYDKDDIWDAPGVLWCGQYSCSNWNPALARSWGNGLNVTGISRQRAGCYTITHNLGHVDYFVHAIGNAQIRDNWNWYNTTVSFFGHSASQFSLLFKDDGGSEKDPAEFQVMIFGRNKF